MSEPLALTFDSPTPLAVLNAAGSEGATGRRLVAGQAVPWNTTARLSTGQLVRFLPDSLDCAGVAVVRDHDSTRPVGVVIDAAHTGDGHQVITRLSATPLGDESLTLAADGVLTGWSVGASATEYSWDHTGDEPVMVVAAGQVRELSLLVNPAYGSASQVTQVAASEPAPESTPPTPNPEPEPESETDMTDLDTTPEVDAAAAPAVVTASAPAVTVKAAPQLSAGEFVVECLLAQKGDRDAAQRILAAAPTPVGTDTNVGIVPPSYVAGILGNLAPYRPAYASVQHAQLPQGGDALVRGVWDTLPVVAKYPTQGAQPPTGAVAIDPVTIPKVAWAHAVSASLALLRRSDPGFATEYYSAAVNSFYGAWDADMSNALLDAAGAPITGATTARGAISAAVAAAVAKQTSGEGVFAGVWPSWCMVGMEVWALLVDTAVLDGPGLSTGTMDLDTPQGSLSGLVVRANPALAGTEVLVGNPQCATAYEQPTVQLSALVVNTLSYELGMYADTAFHVGYADGLAAATVTVTPPAATAAKK